MLGIHLYNKEKEVIGEIQLPGKVFSENPKEHLIYRLVRLQLANKRRGTAAVKNRSQVSGSTRKLFRQKGTGRARMGSAKSPIRRGGGVVFGPQPRDYGFKLPRKVRRKALKNALSFKAQEGNLLVLDNMVMESHKTKDVFKFLKQFDAQDNCLLVVNQPNKNLNLGARNIPGVKVLHVDGINVFDIMKHAKVIVEKDVLETLERRFAR